MRRSAPERSRRRFFVALGVSMLLHGLFFAIPQRHLSTLAPGPVTHTPLNVEIVASAPEAVQAPPERAAEPEPQPAPRPVPVVPRPPRTPPIVTAPKSEVPVPLPPPIPRPPPPREPPVDMMAAMEARRAQRRAAEAAARGPPVEAPPSDAATRNLATLSGREGVGGVFQVLRVGSRTGEFAFNGWRPESRSQWREVIEVDAGTNGNVELAIVRRMIQLIRTHYEGDFHWESHRLGRTVKLSARKEDNEGLEEFMMREFFGLRR